jgi:hypothetical protein
MRGEELTKALREFETGTGPVRLRGFTKPGAAEGQVAFAPEGDCDSWIDLPVALIREAEIVGEARCRDHRHAVTEIELATPSSPDGRVCFEILRSVLRTRAEPSYAMRIGRPPFATVLPTDRWHDWFGGGPIGGGGIGGCEERARADLIDRLLLCIFSLNPAECFKSARDRYARDREDC